MTPKEEIEPGKQPDKPSRFATDPIKKNARTLIGVLVQHFPAGATCEDLRRQFEKDTSLHRQSFYNALNYCKKQGWLIGGARHRPDGGGRDRRDHFQLYNLNPDGSWRPPTSTGEPAGEPLSRDQLEYLVGSKTQQIEGLQSEVERLRDWRGDDANGSGVAIPSLIRIITDSASTMRQRLKAAETILSYKVGDASVVEFTKKFLQSICTGADVATDYRVEAAGLLRRCESPRIAPETVRPVYREAEPAEPPVPLLELVRQRRERQDRMELEALQQAADISDTVASNGGGDTGNCP